MNTGDAGVRMRIMFIIIKNAQHLLLALARNCMDSDKKCLTYLLVGKMDNVFYTG